MMSICDTVIRKMSLCCWAEIVMVLLILSIWQPSGYRDRGHRHTSIHQDADTGPFVCVLLICGRSLIDNELGLSQTPFEGAHGN